MDKDMFYERVNDLVAWTRKLIEARRKDALPTEGLFLDCAHATLNAFALEMGKAMAETMEGAEGHAAQQSITSPASQHDAGRLGQIRDAPGLAPGRAGLGDVRR